MPLLTVCFLAASWLRQSEVATKSNLRLLTSLTTEQLAAYASQKLCFAGDGTLLFSSRAQGYPLAKLTFVNNDPVRRYVSRGLAVVPFLLQHLGDRTSTKVKMPAGPVLVDDYFDSTVPNRQFFQSGQLDANSLDTGHVLTVGDVCFFLLGQIVNRNYDPLLPLGSTIVPLFNGPSATSSLAGAALREWKGLTATKLKQSLISDLMHPKVAWRDVGAIRRLKAYFPGVDIGPLIVKRLEQPITNLDSWDDVVAPYSMGYRRHEVLRFPDHIVPEQMLTLVSAAADLRSKALDAFLASKLRTGLYDRNRSISQDRVDLAIICRLETSGTNYKRLAARFCEIRAKGSAIRSLFLAELRNINTKR